MFRRLSLGLSLFAIILSGCVISPRRDGTTSGGGGGGGGTTATGKLYVTNQAQNAILRFDNASTATGNVAPAATIAGASTTLNSPSSIVLDATANRLFVADGGQSAVLVFDTISTKTGNAAPDRTIAGTNTSLLTPTDLSLDRGRNLLYVVDGTDVLVFGSASTATGNITPL